MLIIGNKTLNEAKVLTSNLIEDIGQKITTQQLCDLLNIYDALLRHENSSTNIPSNTSIQLLVQKPVNYPHQWAKRISKYAQYSSYRKR